MPERGFRHILPRQSEAQAADQARMMALQNPVQPAPVTTDHFPNADFVGQLENFTFSPKLVYPQFQTQTFQPLDNNVLSSQHVAAWGEQMQSMQSGNWGQFQGRNDAEQLSIDTSAAQAYGTGNAAGELEIAPDTERHARTCTDSLPAPPQGEMGMDMVSPRTTTEHQPEPFPMPNSLTEC
jgi:hypothetical protein